MKVCFVLPKTYGVFHHRKDIRFGGAEVQFYQLSRALAAREGWEVHFAVGDYGQEGIEVVDGVTLWPSVALDGAVPMQMLAMYRTLKHIDADIYLQMTLTPYSWAICRWLQLRGKKFVFFLAHDRDTDGSILDRLPTILQRMATRVFDAADLNIAQNRDQLHALTRRRHRVLLLHSSLQGDVIRGGERHYHLWMARAETWKRPELFLDLAAEFPDHEFLMICPKLDHTPDDYYRELTSRASALTNLEFRHNYVAFDAMDELFSRAVTFVNTSVEEGFATTFVHAAQCSVPVLSLNVNPDEYLTEHGCGIVCNGDFGQLKDGLKLMVSEPGSYTKYAAASAAYFQREHRLSKNAATLAHRLESL